jgi:hypothetical protein
MSKSYGRVALYLSAQSAFNVDPTLESIHIERYGPPGERIGDLVLSPEVDESGEGRVCNHQAAQDHFDFTLRQVDVAEAFGLDESKYILVAWNRDGSVEVKND